MGRCVNSCVPALVGSTLRFQHEIEAQESGLDYESAESAPWRRQCSLLLMWYNKIEFEEPYLSVIHVKMSTTAVRKANRTYINRQMFKHQMKCIGGE